jgi:ABC-type transport system involved in cytochrome c biogenesis permease subunit
VPVMPEKIELLLFFLVTGLYLLAWVLYWLGWRKPGGQQINRAHWVLWSGFILHFFLVGFRYYRAGHLPFLSPFEFVTTFALLVVLVFLVFSVKPNNRVLGVFLMPVALGLMLYATFMAKAIEPEIPIFSGLMLKVHVITVLSGYSFWAITFAASVAYLYLAKTRQKQSSLMDQMAYKAAFIAFVFHTISIVTGSLWADQVGGQLWTWDPKETWSFITWLIFLAYLHARYTHDWSGTRAAILAIVGFATLVFTYVGVDYLLPHMHSMQFIR